MTRQRPPEPTHLPAAAPLASQLSAWALWAHWRRLIEPPSPAPLALLWLAFCLACSAVAPVEDAPVVSAADRESWGARLEVRGRQSTVIITAPYVQDFLEGQVARADSGVAIEFYNADGRRSTRVGAGRLTLSYDSQQVSVADCVRLQVDDSVKVTADTLVWQPEGDLLTIPGPVHIEQPQGWTRGRNLRTTPGLAQWSVQEPRTRWRAEGQSAAAALEAMGRMVEVRADSGHVLAFFDSFEAHFEGRSLSSVAARYTDRGGGRMLLSGGVAAADSGWSLAADTLDYDLGSRAIEARGHVELEDGELRLLADQLAEDPGGDRWTAKGGPAVATDGDLSVESTVITFARASQWLAASPARLAQADRLLQADSLVYDRNGGVARAVGGVSLSTAAFAGDAAAGWAEFEPQAGRITMTLGPTLSRGGMGQQVVIGADTLRLDLEAGVLRGTPGFAVSAPPVSVRSRRGEYFSGEDQARLAGQVELLQAAGEGARMKADSMVVHLSGESIARVVVPGSLAGTVGSPATQVTWLSAAAAVVELGEGRLTSIELKGDAEATHREARRGRASRFRAREMTLQFGQGEELLSVRAHGGAQVSAVLPGQAHSPAGESLAGAAQGADNGQEGASYNQVEGEALEIILEAGEVREVRLLESVEGHFLPSAQELPLVDDQPGD